jgi:hypothetical protein
MMKQLPVFLSVGVFVLLLILFGIYTQFVRDDFDLPIGGDLVTETIVFENDVVVKDEQGIGIDEPHSNTPQPVIREPAEPAIKVIKEIFVTEGVRHSVPLDEILGGGPPKDGIPSIDDPKYVSAEDADFIDDNEPGIAISIGGTNRFYPFQILVYHEIVNDTLKNGERILVTYCPLCLSGIVFDPVVGTERVEFGTSGKLWQSNLVMYDRKTDSMWSQVLGESILGDQTGSKLSVLPSDQIRFKEFKALYPEGEVLSRDTGATRFYGRDPYGDYYTTPGTYFPVRNQDDRLEDKDFVLGIVIDGKAKAYYPPAVKKVGRVEDVFAGKTIVVEYDKTIDAVRIFEKNVDGTLERINPFGNFWFSWVAVHPETDLYK